MSERINSSKAPEPVGLYPHARRVGIFLFLSGVGPREKGAKKIPGVNLDENGAIISYDIEAQCRSVFQNVKYILEESGSSWDKIVDVTVFLTNMKDDFQIYNKIYAEYFAENQPCRTTVEINCLPTPIAIELKVIATIEWFQKSCLISNFAQIYTKILRAIAKSPKISSGFFSADKSLTYHLSLFTYSEIICLNIRNKWEVILSLPTLQEP